MALSTQAAPARIVFESVIAPTNLQGPTDRIGSITRHALSGAELSAPQPVHLTLRIRNFEELRERIERGEVLTPGELQERYLPAAEDWQKVANWVSAQGLTISMEDPSRLTVFATGSVARVERALQMKFARVIGTDYAEHTSAITAPSLPADLTDLVIGVYGLQPHLRPLRQQTTPSLVGNTRHISPKTIADHYQVSGLGLDGAGETIVIMGGADVNPSDLTAFWKNAGLPTTIAQFTQVVPFPQQLGDNTYASEETKDIQWASAMAPAAKIVYFASIDPATFVSWIFSQGAAAQQIRQVNISFGLAEATGYNIQAYMGRSQHYAVLAALGISIFASSGDHGSTADVVGNQLGNFYYAPNGTITVDYPASDPFVTAVGGTVIGFAYDANQDPVLPIAEGGWCLPSGVPPADTFGMAAGTGGLSVFFTRPSWQTGPNLPAGNKRSVPDVAAMASGNFSAYTYYRGGPEGFSGTSLSAPIWTGLCALLNQARRQQGLPAMGLLGPKIYPLIGTSSFRQITTGSHNGIDFSPTASIGAYTVGSNYNHVTGLGAPNMAALVAALTQPESGSAPAITLQPVIQNVSEGGTATFTAAASGSPAPSYQWTFNDHALTEGLQFNGSTVSGSTSTTLTITNARGVNVFNLQLRLVATNRRGVAVSDPALLMVNLPNTAPGFVGQLSAQTIASGGSITFAPAFFGSPPFTCQWLKDSLPISGATSPTYTINSAKTGDAGVYTLRVTNGQGVSTTDVTLTVTAALAAPAFTTQPSSQTVATGNSVTFSASATGNPAPAYQWRRNGTNISGATASSLAISSVSTADAGDYTVVASNSLGSTTSAVATLTVGTTAVRLLTNTTVSTGHSATFSAGTAPGSIQWQISTDGGASWSNLTSDGTYSGTSTARLTISNAGPALNNARFRFVATNGSVVTTSNAATLSVVEVFFPFPTGIAADSADNLYVSDAHAGTVQRINSARQVSVVAGTAGTAGSTDGMGAAARFNQPGGLTRLPGGVLIVADTANATLRSIAVDGKVTTLSGQASIRGSADGIGSAATFSSPSDVALDSAGNLFVADSMNNLIRRISADAVVSTFAGAAGANGSADGIGSAARFNFPGAVIVDAGGNILVADTTNNLIRKISSSRAVTTLAGLPGVVGFEDGTGTQALFDRPGGLTMDQAGNLYLADTGNSTIRKITPGGTVTTLAGTPGIAGLEDGTGTDALFNQPRDLTIDSSGNLYVADTGNATIRKVTPGGQVTTLALSRAPEPVVPPPAGGSTGNPPTTPSTPTTPPPSSSGGGGGGGGAPSMWFTSALILTAILRRYRKTD